MDSRVSSLHPLLPQMANALRFLAADAVEKAQSGHPGMIGAGVHINAIGGDCPGKTEIHPDILKRADVFVEYPQQTRIEGDIQQMPADFPVTEIWEVIVGKAKGRVSQHQLTLFDGVGFAIEDFSALRYVRDRLEGTDCAELLDMIADPDDPRDLFGMLQRARPAQGN